MHTASASLVEQRARDAAQTIAKALIEGADATAHAEDVQHDRIELDSDPAAMQ